MAGKLRSMRLSDELWAWLLEEARRRGSTRTGVVEALVSEARVAGLAGEGPVAVSRSSGPVRLDSPSDVRRWMGARQARLNEAKERAS